MANEVEIPISLDNKELLRSISNIEKNMDDLTKKMQSSFEKSTKSVTNSFEKMGSTISGALMPAQIGANLATKALDYLIDTIKGSVTEALNFNRALLEIETILPKNTKLTKQLTDQLEDLAVQYGTNPTAQAKAYYEIISAGVEDTADATKLLVNANKLATGGLADITGVIDTLTTVYNVYGKEVGNAEDASDSLFKTVQLGKTTMSELQSDIGRVLPIAKTFGLSLDEVGASLVMLTNSGLKTREAVSYLTALLVGISRNGKELGSTMNSTAIQTDGFATVMQRIIEKSKGSNDVLIQLIGTSEGVRAIQALNAQGLSKYNSILGEYVNKAGVANEASKKIIENDTSKQWDIFYQNVSKVSREFINVFIPATGSALQALNSLFVTDVTGDVEKKMDNIRKFMVQLTKSYEMGLTPVTDYTASMKRLEKQLTDLANASENATSPTISQVRVLQEEAKKIQSEIGSVKLGFDGLKSIGPLEASVKAGQLEEKLKLVNAQIAELSKKKVTPDAVPVQVVTPEQEATYGKIIADTQALNASLLAEQQNYSAQLATMSAEDNFTRKELELQATYDLEMSKLQTTYDTEMEKTRFIKNEEEKRLTQKKLYADLELKAQTLANKTSISLEKNKEDEKKAIATYGFQTASNFLQAGIKLSKEGSDFQKGLLITQATIDTYAGVNKILADASVPVFLQPALIASTIALGLANVAKIAGAKFWQGGIVGGNSYAGDQVPVQVNSGEMILNRQQQGQLFNLANGGSAGSNVTLEAIRQVVSELKSTPIVVSISGREVARAVREETRSGFSF